MSENDPALEAIPRRPAAPSRGWLAWIGLGVAVAAFGALSDRPATRPALEGRIEVFGGERTLPLVNTWFSPAAAAFRGPEPAWPAVNLPAVRCTVEVPLQRDGTPGGVEIYGCPPALHDAVVGAVRRSRAGASLPPRSGVTFEYAWPGPAPWQSARWPAAGLGVTLLGLVASRARGARRTSDPLTLVREPAAVVRNRSAPMAQRVGAVAELARRTGPPDGLLDVADGVRAVPELAAALVEGVRAHPTGGRLRWLAAAARSDWRDWPDEVLPDAAWVVVHGSAKLATAEAETALAAVLATRRPLGPTVRTQAAGMLGDRGGPVAVRALRAAAAAGTVSAGVVEREIGRIGGRLGTGALAFAAAEGGGLSAPAESGALSAVHERR